MMKYLIFSCLLLLASTAHATTTTYDWTGRSSVSNWKVALDEIVHGTIEIDDQALRTIGEGQPETVRTYNAVHFTFYAGGVNFDSGPQREWQVRNNSQGIADGCMPPTSDPAYFSFNWSVFTRNDKLDLFAANLDQQWMSGNWGMEVSDPNSAKGYFGDGFWGTIESLTRRTELADAGDAAPTPEPSSFVLMGSALAGFGYLRRRRRA